MRFSSDGFAIVKGDQSPVFGQPTIFLLSPESPHGGFGRLLHDCTTWQQSVHLHQSEFALAMTLTIGEIGLHFISSHAEGKALVVCHFY